ncbi:hypothetical protein I5H79_gp094 [Mycobacterium phage Poenanya]|uniref:Uncharacterized protein n=5 Tax=Caudoviricetes TaxID=2731619 RepID=A0A385DN36_9CAUD|nr:hypothetical protein FGG20_gp075 [Mycobacterium phage Baka]YP_009956544.1 hypothetical protein I5H32_gp093 [Mycobacterium phage EleanorGeorge]YP_009957915.1 hypothetical protein I5H45_gp094 [Mycobacterium phage Harley]YP_009961392.1 hypothetical protein I5H79_gp094 [Mycobacterium phage Poenanya]AZS07413.1 hypothetical protein PBI_DUKE13_73 [Mycobacterium phage Duke13]QFP96106.1 hypothetical protein SEA_DOOMPHIST_94 [Mycobacterium phage Doomphist]QXO12892.1 hypothetical protein SEA_LATRETIU
MGMYTEFYFRANITDRPATEPASIVDWLYDNINGDAGFEHPFNDHPFFSTPRWSSVFIGGGAVYQESRAPIFRRKNPFGGISYKHQLVIASSLKNYGDEIATFVDWITPHLDMHVGDFLGYSLYEDCCDDSDLYREHPRLFFMGRGEVIA